MRATRKLTFSSRDRRSLAPGQERTSSCLRQTLAGPIPCPLGVKIVEEQQRRRRERVRLKRSPACTDRLFAQCRRQPSSCCDEPRTSAGRPRSSYGAMEKRWQPPRAERASQHQAAGRGGGEPAVVLPLNYYFWAERRSSLSSMREGALGDREIATAGPTPTALTFLPWRALYWRRLRSRTS